MLAEIDLLFSSLSLAFMTFGYRFCIVCSFLLLAVGCTPYHFFTIKSYDLPPDASALVVDNDTLQITYALIPVNGLDNGLLINVQNKSESPIFVDWSQSAVIIGNTTLYPFDVTGVAQTMAGSQVGNTRFIPPRSSLQSIPIPIQAATYSAEARKKFKKEIVKTQLGTTAVQSLQFTPENSPIRFRSYLTFYSEKAPKIPMRMEHSFWASEVVTSTDDQLFEHLSPKQKLSFDTSPRNKLRKWGM